MPPSNVIDGMRRNRKASAQVLPLHRPFSAHVGKQIVKPYCGSCNTPVGDGWLCLECNDRCECGRLSLKGDVCERCHSFCEVHERHYLKPEKATERAASEDAQAASPSRPNASSTLLAYCQDCRREQDMATYGWTPSVFSRQLHTSCGVQEPRQPTNTDQISFYGDYQRR
ncbi:hypothetical protein BC938DRAFT_484113 [Jimgerdemannia flammicorona]|uniref:Uncharacterized protein n=1 Tax=Jimgerdemannia flammicorona TaxID=994334 RepID=A0A433QAN6_9FUNG|nr:hypothetical protein BC938DRAFT_484113 [Jimgerdemannia flammicorona]